MYLVADIGNTNTKLALFAEGEMVQSFHWPGDNDVNIKAILNAFSIDGAIVSAVADMPFELGEILTSVDGLMLSAETPLPFKVAYNTPRTLGKDRIAAVAGALELHPGKPLLVVDTGTCVTYERVVNGVYEGGNITPGPELRYLAMHHFTDKLPLVERPHAPVAFDFGKSTEEAMQNGGLMGCVLEMDAYINNMRKQFGDLTVIVSGGDAEEFAQLSEYEIFAVPELVLIGLERILKYNIANEA